MLELPDVDVQTNATQLPRRYAPELVLLQVDVIVAAGLTLRALKRHHHYWMQEYEELVGISEALG